MLHLFGKRAQEVIYFGRSTRSACLDYIPLALSYICVGVFSNVGRLNHMDLELIKRRNMDNFCNFTIREIRENLTMIGAEILPMLHLRKK